MFESAELDHKIDNETFDQLMPRLREDLLNAQFDLVEAKEFPVIILIAGADGAGKAQAVNGLNAILDIHYVSTIALGPPTEEARERPPMWRYWRALPPKGRIGIFFGSWYSDPLRDRILGVTKNADLHKSLEEINRLEEMLADEGALILKFWFHLSREQQKKRLKKLKKDPTRYWRLADRVLDSVKNYDRALSAAEHVVRLTSTGYAPWTVIGGTDKRYRGLMIANTLLYAISKRLEKPEVEPVAPAPIITEPVDEKSLLSSLDLSLKLERDDYKRQLKRCQRRLNHLSQQDGFRKKAVVAVFEGNDAAGKGGAIRRATEALDATLYRVHPVAAPTEEERVQPYLWRFWRRIPRLGHLTFFDRSWYGRVLVERVEGFCSEADWLRAYAEINDFESELARHDIVVVKFWLSISKDEQEKRFKAREEIGYKRYKLTDEDWRNREKWDLYARAVCDMVDRTSTERAPWTLVEANDKCFARIKVLKTLRERIEAAL
jgi:AMP-polyphosphate phosphotransferase